MSKTVDERVVEMRFDNAQFEKNVQTSMSTLSKLKQSLKFTDASKGLESLEKSAGKIRFDGMINGIDTVNARFSYLQGAIQHQINNIVDTCVNAGKRMVSAITINPVKDGFAEYETQMNAVQTILANTQKEGTNVKVVNAALDELNHYADMTIYNFTEMTRNIGTFTAAGVKLDTSVSAIKGIANLAAVSGSTSQQASTAMYQLSQALAAGTVKLMDWNSVVNAGMGGQVFQDALVRTSEHLKTGAKEAIAAKGSFRESLQTGWLTTEVLTETLDMFATAADTQEEYEAAVQKFVSKGYTQEEAKQMADMAKTAGAAATKVKTFSQLIDTLKEALGSGWTETWRLIIGDFEEAKEVWTSVSDVLSGFINKVSDARNSLVKSALGQGFSELSQKIKGALEPAQKAMDTVQDVTSSIADLGSIVDDVIIGKFGNGQERFDALTQSGVNWCRVQNEVNEKLGCSFRYTQEQIDAQDKLIGAQKEATDSTASLNDEQKKQLKELLSLSDAQLKSKGYTDDQIAALKELKNTANKLGIPVDKFIDKLDQINGRWLMIEGFKNVGRAIVKVFSSMSQAAKEVFDAIKPETIFNTLAAFHRLTAALILSDENADKLKRTFKGLFAIIDIIKTITGGGLSIAFKVFAKAIGAADVNILDFTARLGDAIVKFRDFLFNNELVNETVDLLTAGFEKIAEVIGNIINLIVDNPVMDKMTTIWDNLFGATDNKNGSGIITTLKELGNAMGISSEKSANFKSVMDGINSAFNVSNWKWAASLTSTLKLVDSILGLFGTDLIKITAQLANYITKFAEWVKVHTPFIEMQSKIASALKTVIEGIGNCVKAFSQLPAVQKIIQNFKDTLTQLFGDLNKGFDSVNIESFCNKIKSAFDSIQKWIEKAKDTDKLGLYIVQGIRNGIVAGANHAKDAVVNIVNIIKDTFCSLLGIHSPSKWGYDRGKNIIEGIVNGIKSGITILVNTVKSVVDAIKGSFKSVKLNVNFDNVLGGLQTAILKFKDATKGFDWKYLLTLIPVGIALMFAKRFFSLIKTFEDGINGLNSVISGLAGVEKSLSKVLDSFALDIKTKALQRVATSLAILVGAIIALTFVDTDKLYGAVATVGLLAGILTGLMIAVSKLDNASVKLNKESKGIDISGLKTTILQIGATLLMLATAVKIMGSMNSNEMTRGFVGLAGTVAAVGTVLAAFGILAKMNATKDIDKVSGTILKVSVAMLMMVGVCKLAANLKPEEMKKGAIFASAFSAFVVAMSLCYRLAGNNINKLGGMILKITLALGLMVGVCKLVAQLKPSEMVKGAVFASGFTVFVGALVLVSKLFPQAQIQKISGLVLSISVSLGLMVGVCKLVSQLSADEMKKGAAFASGFLVFVGILVKVTSISSDAQTAKVAATILAISTAIGALAVVSVLLGLVDTKSLIKGTAAVVALGGIMTAMIWATRGANECKSNLIIMTTAIAVMAGAVAALCLIDSKKLTGATASLAILMGAFTLMEKMATDVKGAWKSLLIMSAVVAGLAGILTAMNKLNVDSSIQNASSLSILLISMVSSLRILSNVKTVSKNALGAMGVLTAVVAGLVVILGVMDKLNVNPSIETATSLSILLMSMSVVTAVLSALGPVGKAAADGAVAMITVTTILGTFLVALGVINDKIPQAEKFLNEGIPLLQAIGEGIGAFIGGIVAGFAGGMLDILPKFGKSLSDFMVNISGFIDGAGKIDSSVIAGAGYLSGAIIALSAAEFISGIASFMTINGDLGQLGTDLSAFIKNSDGFIQGVSKIDPSSAEAAGTLSKMILKLSEASFISGITSLLTLGKGSFDNLGEQLNSFGKAMVTFSETVAGKINSEAITAASNAGQILAELEKSLSNKGGLLQDLVGTADIAAFGERCVAFGEAITKFSKTIDANGGVDETSIQKAASAGKVMAKLEDVIPKNDGVLQDLVGQSDLANFGIKCVAFGEAITKFSNSVKVDDDVIQKATTAGKAMAELQKAIPEKHIFDGKISLDTFGSKIRAFGNGLSGFAANVADVDFGIVKKAVTQSDRLKNLAQSMSGISADGIGQFKEVVKIGSTIKNFSEKVSGISVDTISQSISAANRLKNLISNLVGIDASGVESFKVGKIGTAMRDYAEKVSGIDPSVVMISASSAVRLANLIRSMVGIDPSGVESFKPSTIGSELNKYASKVSEMDITSVYTSVAAARYLLSFINSLAGTDGGGATTFVQALNTLGTASVDNFVAAFSSAGPKVSAAMNSMMTSMATAVTLNTQSIVIAFNNTMNSVVTIVSSKRAAFVTAGTGLMLGVASGVTVGSASVSTSTVSAMARVSTILIGQRGRFVTAGVQLMSGLGNGIRNGTSTVTSAIGSLLTTAQKLVNTKRSQFQLTGTQLMQSLAKGIRSSSSTINSAISTALINCGSAIRAHYSSFSSAGEYLGDGLVIGINHKKTAAYNAGFALGKAAVDGEKAGQQSRSPSKLTIKAGHWLGEGLVIGMKQMGVSVYQTGKNIGTKAVDSISGALHGINNISENDLSLSPSIRPVVNMDGLQNGPRSLEIGADLSANLLSKPVSSLQEIVSQAQADINTSNSEVIKAINDLRNDLAALYADDDKEIALYMDAKKVASTIAKPMNRQLLELQKRGSR